ncbi:MAG: RpiB/LacA/LacB family sugar-phosphate isomerase, partial [bacterium]
MKKLITEREVIAVWRARSHEIRIPFNGVVTPAAADFAKAHGIEIIKHIPQQNDSPGSRNALTDKIVIGSDHGGFELKELLKTYLLELGFEIEDVGTHSTDSVDYPDFAHQVAQKVARERSRG